MDRKERQNNNKRAGVCCQLVPFWIEYLDEIMTTDTFEPRVNPMDCSVLNASMTMSLDMQRTSVHGALRPSFIGQAPGLIETLSPRRQSAPLTPLHLFDLTLLVDRVSQLLYSLYAD